MAKKIEPQALHDATNDLAAAAQHLRVLIRQQGADSAVVADRFADVITAVKDIDAELVAARNFGSSPPLREAASRLLKEPTEISDLASRLNDTRATNG